MIRFLLLLLSTTLLIACSIPKPLIDRIKESGELIVVTRENPATYYRGRDGIKGVEHELVKLFAESLGVKVKYLVPDSFEEIIPLVVRGDAHFAAAGLTITPKRRTQVKFTPPYQEISQQLVYRAGNRRPKDITDTDQGTLEVVAGSAHDEVLHQLKREFSDLEWVSQKGLETDDLLRLVKEQVIDYTIVGSHELALSRRFYPELRAAFNISQSKPLAWAFPHAEDSSLYNAARDFMKTIRLDGTLEQILDRYYGHVDTLDFVGTRAFRRHYAQRLPALLPYFKQAALDTGIEWQFLAAIGYQESHWNPKAVSPTGVRGVMMLTQATAKQMKIEDRTDPEQSIMGGARYMRIIEEKIPERIPEPDRLWLALAGYNVGFGHLEDARILTQRSGGNPDKWVDVKKYLPLLAKKKYYKDLKHGYARGHEPVAYVDNIRSYYDLILWQENGVELELARPKPKITTPVTL